MKNPANRGSGSGADEDEQQELFARNFTATFPNPDTKDADVLRIAATGAWIRQRDYLGLTWRLAAHIERLRSVYGWPFEARPVSGHPREVEYRLQPRAIAELGGVIHA